MNKQEKVINGMGCCIKRMTTTWGCGYDCPYYHHPLGCKVVMLKEAISLLKAQEEERKRMITWLAKFCRHIDNGDRWLTDQENLEFFKEKMKRQFGWEFPEPPKEG